MWRGAPNPQWYTREKKQKSLSKMERLRTTERQNWYKFSYVNDYALEGKKKTNKQTKSLWWVEIKAEKESKQKLRESEVCVIPKVTGGKGGSRQEELRANGTWLLCVASAEKVDPSKSWREAPASSHKEITDPKICHHHMWNYRTVEEKGNQ